MSAWNALQWVGVGTVAWVSLAAAVLVAIGVGRSVQDQRIKRYAEKEGISESTARSILRNKGSIK